MQTYIVAFFLAVAVAAILTPVVARLARRKGWLDAPGQRKVHTRAVPRLGGVAVVVAFFAPVVGLGLYTNRVSSFLFRDGNLVLGLCVGGLVIATLGVYDDLRGADARLKLIVQSLVAVGMWLVGFRIELFSVPVGNGVVELGRLSLPLTVLWFVGVINALNLIDGLDGLASGIALFAVLVLFGVSYFDHAVLLSLLSIALAGALVGFLFFNFNPAKIFLGDSGSMFIGFALAAISIWTQRKGATAVALAVPVLALGVPILDVTLSVVRRLSRGTSPFRADREHVHHRLLALGLSHRRAVMTLYALSVVFGVGALALLRNDTATRAIALSVIGFAVFLTVRKVGVVRFPSIFRRADGTMTGLRHELRAAARRIRTSVSPDDAWSTLTEIVRQLGCDEARLAWCLDRDLLTQASQPQASKPAGERVFHWRRDRRPAKDGWHVAGAPNRAVVRLTLDEDELQLGELAVLLARRDMTGARVSEFRIALELLRDALIDFLVEHLARQKVVRDGRIVRLAGGAGTGGVVGAPTGMGRQPAVSLEGALAASATPVGGFSATVKATDVG